LNQSTRQTTGKKVAFAAYQVRGGASLGSAFEKRVKNQEHAKAPFTQGPS
jgi:hypothetical protein